MNWLITGGGGFIGSNFIAHLRARGPANIRVVDDFSAAGPESLSRLFPTQENISSRFNDCVQLIRGDVRDARLAHEALQNMDVVVHLAAQTGVADSLREPEISVRTNVLGTMNYLEAARARGIEKFIFASSNAALGPQEMPLHEQRVPEPITPYGASKLAGEALCLAYARSFSLPTIALRFSNVYGPRGTHKNSLVAKFCRRALRGDPLEIFGAGEQTRDFLFVADVATGIERAALSPSRGEIFHLGTGVETSVREVARQIQALAHERGGVVSDCKHLAPALGDVPRNYSDCAKAKTQLGWQAAVDLPRGLRETFSYYAAH